MRAPLPPLVSILAGAFCISFSAVWVKLATVPPAVSAFYRVFFGFCFLALICIWQGEYHPLNRQHLLWGLGCGLLFALDLYCWHASIQYVGPGLATILGNFQVFVLSGVGVLFFRERLHVRFLLALPLALWGLSLLVGGSWLTLGEEYRWGIILGLLTALCYSGFLLILRKLQAEARTFSFFFNLMLVSGASAFFLGIFLGGAHVSFAIPDGKSWISLLALGLLSQTIGWTLISGAMPEIRTSLTGFILLVQPLLSFLWDVLLFHRLTSVINWVGVTITLLALYLGMQSGRRLPETLNSNEQETKYE